MMWRATNSGVSSNMWMKPCSSRSTSFGHVLAGARLAVDVDRDVGVLEADLLDELAQVQHRRVELGAGRELLVVDDRMKALARLCCCANWLRSP
jgi:hypothetical protein